VVFIQDVATGKRRQMANYRGSNSAPAWSPDGTRLTVTLSRDGVSQLYLINRNGGEVRRITQSGAIDTESVWAPDGKTVYFVSDRGGSPQIYRLTVADGNTERVTFQGAYNISPDPSPDGRYLSYINRQGNVFRLTLLDLNTGVITALSETVDDESPSFAPNSRMIMYSTRVQGREVLMTTSLDGRIKSRLGGAAQADVREPVWGPLTVR
jgi:TolB protein